MIVRPWEVGDTLKVDIQKDQQYLIGFVDLEEDLTPHSELGWVKTGVFEGEVMFVAGVFPHWENRFEAYLMMSQHAGRCMTSIHRYVKQFLDNFPSRRIETPVDVGFKEGHRWVKMLGFEPEGYMKCYRHDGADMVLYARIK